MKDLNKVMFIENLGKDPEIQESRARLADNFMMLGGSASSKSAGSDKANINETFVYKREVLRLYRCCV